MYRITHSARRSTIEIVQRSSWVFCTACMAVEVMVSNPVVPAMRLDFAPMAVISRYYS